MSDSQAWYAVFAWLLVAACGYAAFIFGRFARASFERYPRGHIPTRTRVGVAISINGPLVGFVIGLIAAAITGYWLTSALGTFVGIVIVTGLGLYLAPR
ncbi:hypothetical protein CLV47_103163 [Antricoccus suffuscus]|uniref:Uncharacterized protein n=1 Tax=Antricoccus suffuscus TaxID=1629062 RepID=A0A2T1A3D9_9ACTN|nr:hypothetical protein [Antricoccus suffuscus]PRZ43106.1 hypothetical protein CLV47_103163 [Antricoccus suffuscus]